MISVQGNVLIEKRISLLASSPSSYFLHSCRWEWEGHDQSIFDGYCLPGSQAETDMLHCWSLATSFYKDMRQVVKQEGAVVVCACFSVRPNYASCTDRLLITLVFSLR